ncbi:hypothetical protein PRK78_004472 [Emydomyces testavorans]|uniref:MFS transporter n=1 Tax=Emydomyces testavorans TaxID=2070801 RepID=A0AAF0DHU9_9EURO|nr:hypothetical protein PRK78_004472 [Emydomyces testavorans]
MLSKCRRWKNTEILGAYDVSKWKRIAQICAAVTYSLLAAGIIFGYAALKPVLVKEGIYRDRCTKDELDEGIDVCYGQEIRLNLMFTVAAVVTNICALPVGSILDTCGPRITGSIGGICIALGALLFSNPTRFPYDGYLAGYILFAIGGPFVFISSFHLSNTFPKHSGLILSMLTGAFDCSSAVFLLFRLVHGKANGFFTIKSLFLLFLIVPGFIIASQMLLMPSRSYSTLRELLQHAEEILAEDDAAEVDYFADIQANNLETIYPRYQGLISKINTLLDEPGHNLPSHDPSKPAFTADPTWGIMHTSSSLQQLRSPWFILITLFTITQMLRVNYFISTIRPQYEHLLASPHQARHLNHLFDFLLPLGGLIAMPFTGLILDRTALPTILALLVTSATLIGILGCIPHSLPAAYANITLFVLLRPYFYTVISDYAAKVFGFQTFGRVYGLIICLAGLGNFLQSPLDVLTMRVLRGDPVPVNAGLTGVGAVTGGALAVFVWWRMRRLLGGGVPGGGVEETERLLPGALDEGREGPYGAFLRDGGMA